MTKEEFLKQRQDDWERFEALLSFAEGRRVPRWGGDDISEFSHLFRAICYDLALVRSRDWGLALNRYLNTLVARGHNTLYRAPPGSFRRLLRFFTSEFPWLLRANLNYFLVALFLFVVPGLVSGVLLAVQPQLASRMFAPAQLEQFEEMYSPDKGPLSQNEDGEYDGGARTYMAGFYIRNNIGIAFQCFATGILFGLGTVFFLVYNSLAIGGIAGYMVAVGNSLPFFSFVISHGAFELTAIVVSGAAGLVIGHGLVHPGPLTRRESLKIRGRVGVRLAVGAGAMLAIAALIEGFWSPSPAPEADKFLVGGLFWAAVIAYLSLGGRGFVPPAETAAGIEELS